jgi:DNA-binding LytR/AlgR family response regulator
MQQITPFSAHFRLTIRYLLLLSLFLVGTLCFAQKEDAFGIFTREIDSLARLSDTTGVTNTFSLGWAWAQEQGINTTDTDFMEFDLSETHYLLKFSKIAVDSAISRYQSVYNDAISVENYLVQAKSLGYLANAFRSKRELGKAFEYNQKEIIAADLSSNKLLLGRAYITELDIAYNSLPSPMQAEDLNELIAKGEYVIRYSEENNLLQILPFGKLYLSKFYIKQGEFAQATEIIMSISDDEPLGVSFSKYEHLCEIAMRTGDLEAYRAHTLAFKSRAYQTKRAFVALNAHNYLLDYSLAVNDRDSATYYANRLEHNLKEVDTTKYLDFLDVSYSNLANYYHGNDPEKELQYLSYSTKINKIISSRQKEAFSAILKYNHEVAQLEEENSRLAQTNLFIKNNLFLVLGLVLLLGVVVVVVLRKYKRSRENASDAVREKQEMAQTIAKKHIELNNKQRIYFDDLKYLKADRNYVEFHTEEKSVIDRNSLGVVLEKLPPNFVQVHRSFVINRNFIKASTGTHILLLPDIEIPLSRSFKNNFNGLL